MSFKKMLVEDLKKMAEQDFGIELRGDENQDQVIAALNEQGVTWKMAVQFNETANLIDKQEQEKKAAKAAAKNVVTTETVTTVVEKEEIPVQPVPQTFQVVEEDAVKTVTTVEPVLVRMDRENPVYHIRGYKFTREHPFVLVNPEDATYIVTHEEGFYIASPGEVQEFYA